MRSLLISTIALALPGRLVRRCRRGATGGFLWVTALALAVLAIVVALPAAVALSGGTLLLVAMLPVPPLGGSSPTDEKILLGLEVAVVVFWGMIVTRPFLDLDPAMVPAGEEYPTAIQSHHVWTWVRECGWCGVWNGSTHGGAPTFANMYGSMLHPLVILTNLGWGVSAGTKLALVGTFLMAGLAQWWLGYVLGLGRIARTWSGCMAVVAGHMARIELGTFGLVLSTAACALVLPPLISVSHSGSRRMAVVLGVVVALAALAGQGYMQIGLAATAPAILLLLPLNNPSQRSLIIKRYALAGVLALLLAAPFLVPFLHFLPQVSKFTIKDFNIGQPATYTVLNLVIDDYDFYNRHIDILHKPRHPWLYINFVGWIPLLLALWGVRGGRSSPERRAIRYLAALALLALWVASRTPLTLLADIAPPSLAEWLAGLRYFPVVAGLAVPPILALAAIGADKLLAAPAGHQAVPPTSRVGLLLPWLQPRWMLIPPMVLALVIAWSFATSWITTRRVDPHVQAVLERLHTPDMQWVSTPWWQHAYVEPAVAMGLKLADGVRPWGWKQHADPQPFMWAASEGSSVPTEAIFKATAGGLHIYAMPEGREYAAISHPDGSRTICHAYGTGGNIDVHCNAPAAGVLTVMENAWTGWRAWIDGEPGALEPFGSGPLYGPDTQWLRVRVPAESRLVQFRYRPWDVQVGLVVCAAGIVGAIYAYWKKDDRFL